MVALTKYKAKMNNKFLQPIILSFSFLGLAYSLMNFNSFAMITAYTGIILFFVIKTLNKEAAQKHFELVIILAAFPILLLFMSFIYNSEILVNSYTLLFMLMFVGFNVITYVAIMLKNQHALKALYYSFMYSLPFLSLHSILIGKVSEQVLQYTIILSYIMYAVSVYWYVKKALEIKKIAKLTLLSHKLDVNDKSKKKLAKSLRNVDPVKYSAVKPMLNSEYFSANYINRVKVGPENMTIFLVGNYFTKILKSDPEILYSFNGRYFKGLYYNPIKLFFDIPFKIFGRYSSLIVVDEPNSIKQPFIVTLGGDKYYVTSISKINDTLKLINRQNTKFRSFSKGKKDGKTVQN